MTTRVPRGYRLTSTGGKTFNLYKNGGDYYTKENFEGLFEFYSKFSDFEMQMFLREYLQDVKANPGIDLAADPFLAYSVPVSDEDLKKIELLSTFPKIKLSEVLRLIKLYQYFCIGGEFTQVYKNSASVTNYEVGALPFFNVNTREIKFLIPEQTVYSGFWKWDIASKENQTKLLYFLDGTQTDLPTLIQAGWIMIGTSHSHNTINCTWSGHDKDKQVGELSKGIINPPGIHLLAYNFQNYEDLGKQPTCDLLVSGNVNGHWVDFQLEDIIENDLNAYYEYAELTKDVKLELLKSVVRKGTYVSQGGYAGYAGQLGYSGFYRSPKNQAVQTHYGYPPRNKKTPVDDCLDELAFYSKYSEYTEYLDIDGLIAKVSKAFVSIVEKNRTIEGLDDLVESLVIQLAIDCPEKMSVELAFLFGLDIEESAANADVEEESLLVTNDDLFLPGYLDVSDAEVE